MSSDDGAAGTPPSLVQNHSLAPPPRPKSASSQHKPSFPAREDCWTEEATHTLVEAWGTHHLGLNRGSLRQNHWQDVADAVNAVHGATKKLRRTGVQCKNRIDTLKKRYKVEKARVSDSHGRYEPTWPFFAALNRLIGSNYKSPSPAPPPLKSPPALPPPPWAVPVAPRSKRPADEPLSRRNFSAMAAAAAAAAAAEDSSRSRSRSVSPRIRKEGDVGDRYSRLAEEIRRFTEVYERVEMAKQREMLELEKQRMRFAKDIELQRMKIYMESQIQIEKIKKAKRFQEGDAYL